MTHATLRTLIMLGIVGTVSCSVAERTVSQPSPIGADATVAALRGRFTRRVSVPPQRLDANLTQPKVTHPLVLPNGASNPLTAKNGVLEGPNEALAKVPVVANGAITLAHGTVTASVSLNGSTNVRAWVADGYAVYAGAAPGGGTVAVRTTMTSVEDYVTYESAPVDPAATYHLSLGAGVAGLRLVDGTLELLDASGTPALRMRRPYLVDADENTIWPTVTVSGCQVDTSGRAPWRRSVTAPGGAGCDVRISWAGKTVKYPAVLDPSWSETSAMVHPRTKHVSATIRPSVENQVLVVGGVDKDGFGNLGAELYDAATGTWAETTAPDYRPWQDHAMVVLQDGRAMMATGLEDGTFHNDVDIYDPTAATWTLADGLGTARRAPIIAVLPSGDVLIAGGWIESTSDYTASAERWDATSDSWSSTGSMSTARGNANVEMLNTGFILVAGGASGTSASGNLTSAERYDQSTGSWSSAGTMTTARSRAAIGRMPFDQKVMMAGGATTGATTATATTDVYDPTTNSWSAGPSMTSARLGAAFAAVPGSRLIIAGGFDGSTSLTSVEIWDEMSGSWATDDSTVQARHDATGNLFYHGPIWQVLVSGMADDGRDTADAREPEHPMGDSRSPLAVNVDFSSTNLTGSLSGATTIGGSVANIGSSSLSIEVFQRSFGLDQRTERRSIATYTVAGGSSQSFSFAVNTIPIQSVGMQSELQLEAEYTPSGGPTVVVASAPLYYDFASGYGSATFTGWSAADDATTTPSGAGTAFTRALDSVRSSASAVFSFTGRYWNGTSWTSYDASTAETKGTYYFRDERHREYDPGFPTAENWGSDTPGSGTVRMCARWRGQFEDGGKGEAYGNTTAPYDYPAARSRFIVTTTAANAPIYYDGYLDTNGCTGYMALDPGNYILIQDSIFRDGTNGTEIDVVYGGWDPRTVAVPANGIPESADPQNAGTENEFAPWEISEATGFTVPSGSNGETYILTPSYTDMAARAAATVTRIILSPDNGIEVPQFAFAPTFRVISNKVCPNTDDQKKDYGSVAQQEACGDFPGPYFGRVYLGPTLDGKSHTTRSKVTIAHEFGHSVQGRNMGFQHYAYGWSSGTPDMCNCTHVVGSGSNAIHCLQSREYIGGAEVEGLAQFYASRIWNNPASSSCVFTYYKPFRVSATTVVGPPTVLSCKNAVGTNPKWMITNCDSTDEGVEYDWMLFLYAINTGANATTFNNLSDIYKTMCTGGLSTKCNFFTNTTWNGTHGMLPAAQGYFGAGDARFLLFSSTGSDTGVNR